MSSKRHISICREGWYYLFVLSFIVGGAVLRQINLLFVMAGLMIGPLILNWRFVAATLRRLDARRQLPQQIFSGDLLMVDVVVTNRRRRLGSWAVVVQDWIELQNAPSRRNYRTTVEVLVAAVAAGDESRASYRCYLQRRGRYVFGPLKISTKFPMGLVRAASSIARRDEVVVCPRLGHLTPQWMHIVEADRSGDQRSRHQRALVEGGDFYGIRNWRSGDSKHWIHWRASAKLSNLAVRQFEQQQSRDLAIVLDLWQPADATPQQLNAVEMAVSFAATVIADSCRTGGNDLNIVVSGASQIHHQATASLMFMQQMMEQLAEVEAGDAAPIGRVLDTVLSEMHHGVRPIVVSTRGDEVIASLQFADDPLKQMAFEKLLWVDVTTDELARYFYLEFEPGARS